MRYRMQVVDYIARFLSERGADRIFAISGASNVRLIDAVARRAELAYTCPHHEQAGVMAALAYHRVAGRPAVMTVTAGPGGLNAITGVADAWLDSLPLLVLAGQEKSQFLADGLRGHGVQGLPLARMVAPVTKLAATLEDPTQVRALLEKAWHMMHVGRPGPVWLDLPQDLQTARINPDQLEPYLPPAPPPFDDVDAAAALLVELIERASRPLLWVGHGVRLANAVDTLRRVVDRLGVPVLCAWNGSDLLAEDHQLYAGRAGVYGQRAANFALQNCDLIAGLGTRMAIPQRGYEDAEFARAAVKFVVDIDRAELSKWRTPVHHPVHADVGDFLRAVERQSAPSGDRHGPWRARITAWRGRYPPVTVADREKLPERINSYHFIDRLSAHLPDDAIVVTDMGTSLTCTHAAIRLREGHRLITSTGLGEMGYGLPAAIGAALAAGGRPVVFIGTEGSLMMNLQELQTWAHLALPIKAFLLNNDAYLTIYHTEMAMFGDRLSACTPETGVSFPDLAKVVPAFGIGFQELTDSDLLDEVIVETLSAPGPRFVNVRMPSDQFLGPKTAVKVRADGSVWSPPLEDLKPFLSREELAENMLVPLLPEDS